MPKVTLPKLHPWLKAIDILKVIKNLPWGKEVPDPSIFFDIKKQAQIFMKIPKAFFSRDPMDGSKSPSAPESESGAKKRMIGQEATLNGKPVVWDGEKWVAPEVLEDRGVDRIDDQDDQDLGLTPMSNTVNVGLKNIVPTENLMAKGVGTGQAVTGVVGMTSGRGGRWGKHHAGVDIGTSGQAGWHVSFALSGVVSDCGTFGTYGKLVVITCGNKDFTFAHLKRIDVRKGQRYNGEIIGEIGNTGGGNSTGIHLHFEAAPAGLGGRPGHDLDPMPYVKHLRIGRLGQGTPQTQLLATEESDVNAPQGDLVARIDPATGERQAIRTDPRREQQKNAGQVFMESIGQLASLFAAQPEQEQSKPKIATLPVPMQGEGGNNKGQTTTSMQQVASSQALNSYWQTTLFTKLSV